MFNASKIVKTWETDGFGWSIAPDGIPWCRKGSYVQFGKNIIMGEEVIIGDSVRVGNNVQIGNWVEIGDEVEIGNNAKLCNNVKVRGGAYVGHRVRLCKEVKLEKKVKIGNGVRISKRIKINGGVDLGFDYKLKGTITWVMDLGVQSGYRHTLIQIDNKKFRFIGGCHMFTFKEAKKYWKGKEHRRDTLLAVKMAKGIAKNRKAST